VAKKFPQQTLVVVQKKEERHRVQQHSGEMSHPSNVGAEDILPLLYIGPKLLDSLGQQRYLSVHLREGRVTKLT